MPVTQTAQQHASGVFQALSKLAERGTEDPIEFTRNDIRGSDLVACSTRCGVLGALVVMGFVKYVGKVRVSERSNANMEKYSITRADLQRLKDLLPKNQ